MASAQTGTGKTAAFALPVLQNLLPFADSGVSPAKHPIRALILTPTRELAIQVETSVRCYAQYTGLRSAVVYGGVDIKTQTPQLKAGVEILVATPGRLLDHLQQKTLRLNQVSILVLDEADRMLDMGFLPDLKRIMDNLPAQRQTLMFSATFSDDIKKLADNFLHQPQVVSIAADNTTSEMITQRLYAVSMTQKEALVLHLLKMHSGATLIFTNTKIATDKLYRRLVKHGLKADAIHGDKTQQERIKALNAFKAGELQCLVATDVAARGLDIQELPLVINYEIPSAAEDYVHRIGRTGRAGIEGIALSLMSEHEEEYIVAIEQLTRQTIERVALPDLSARRSASSRTNAKPANSSNNVEQNWFHQPYQAIATTTSTPQPKPIAARNTKTPVAALLGGVKPK